MPQPLWTMLRLARVWSSVHFFRERKVTHVYGGFPLSVWLTDPLAQGWYDADWKELPEIALLKTARLKNGARVFDLGAHQCVVAMMLSRIVGTEGQVVALEANPHNAEIGERNRVLNDIAQLKVVHGAAAKDSGTIDFGKGLNGAVVGERAGLGTATSPCVLGGRAGASIRPAGCPVHRRRGFRVRSFERGSRDSARAARRIHRGPQRMRPGATRRLARRNIEYVSERSLYAVFCRPSFSRIPASQGCKYAA